MKKLVAVVLAGVCILWCTSAFAAYSSLGDNNNRVFGGLGGIYLSGKDNTGASQTQILPTVNLSGVSDTWYWQLFYGFGSGATFWGGNADYILADNMDKCATCADNNGYWWFGAGLTAAHYTGLFDDGTGATGVSATDFGPNLVFGWADKDWSLQFLAHYLVSNQTLGAEASINYAFN